MARYIDLDALLEQINDDCKYAKATNDYQRGCNEVVDWCVKIIKNIPTADVVPRSEVEELQKKLNDYKKFVGEIRVTSENHAVIIGTEHTEYIDKRVAEGFKNMAVKQAKQEVARAILEGFEGSLELMHESAKVTGDIMFYWKTFKAEIEKKYIGE